MEPEHNGNLSLAENVYCPEDLIQKNQILVTSIKWNLSAKEKIQSLTVQF